MAVTVASAALIAVLVSALTRPRGWPEAVVAVPAAALVVLTGAIALPDALAVADRLLPVVGFLAAVLVLARLCDDEGLFRAAGAAMARVSSGNPVRLLAMVFVVAAATTAILSLDATAVLLTPVVLATARRLGVAPRPHAYATAHLANSASLLLPVSNLTNLLAFGVCGLSFTRFTALMTLPWLAAIACEFVLLRRLFRADLSPAPSTGDRPAEPVGVPVFVLTVLGLTLTGFAVTSWLGIAPAWAALAGALVLGVHGLARGRTTAEGVLSAANLPFLAFVVCLGIVVEAVRTAGLDGALAAVLPDPGSLWGLLGIAAAAAVLANAVNNLPAVLALLPLVSAAGPAAVLAVLIGVNIGPNLSYLGSLSNLLWRDAVQPDIPAGFGEFSRIGLMTAPLTLVASVLALWVSLQLFGT